jgi:predicted nucleotidyltransferase component of viral defense system
MIPEAYIREWANYVPWQSNDQVEQDLVICRALVTIFSDEWLAASLAFRGGTALHKLYLQPQPRYSEDIDLVQIRPEPIKETVQRLQKCLEFLGTSTVEPKRDGIQLKFRFDSEIPPVVRLRLKVEANTREHFTTLGYTQLPFAVDSSWFKGACNIQTYKLEELLGTKLRALYQRRKGRDLYDMYKALTLAPKLDKAAILSSYHEYMKFSVDEPPAQKVFLQNMEAKMKDDQFLGDITGLIRPDENYEHPIAYELVCKELIEKI